MGNKLNTIKSSFIGFFLFVVCHWDFHLEIETKSFIRIQVYSHFPLDGLMKWPGISRQRQFTLVYRTTLSFIIISILFVFRIRIFQLIVCLMSHDCVMESNKQNKIAQKINFLNTKSRRMKIQKKTYHPNNNGIAHNKNLNFCSLVFFSQI